MDMLTSYVHIKTPKEKYRFFDDFNLIMWLGEYTLYKQHSIISFHACICESRFDMANVLRQF